MFTDSRCPVCIQRGIHLTQVIGQEQAWWAVPNRAGRLVPLLEAEAGASEEAKAPAPPTCCQLARLSQVDTFCVHLRLPFVQLSEAWLIRVQ